VSALVVTLEVGARLRGPVTVPAGASLGKLISGFGIKPEGQRMHASTGNMRIGTPVGALIHIRNAVREDGTSQNRA